MHRNPSNGATATFESERSELREVSIMEKKAQSAIEFLILIGAMLFFFISMLAVFQQDLALKAKEKRTLEVQEIALTVQNEINIAAEATDGYQRQFTIPQTILNLGYEITLTEGVVYIKTDDGKHAMALPIPEVTGQIQKGTNTIQKQNSEILITQP